MLVEFSVAIRQCGIITFLLNPRRLSRLYAFSVLRLCINLLADHLLRLVVAVLVALCHLVVSRATQSAANNRANSSSLNHAFANITLLVVHHLGRFVQPSLLRSLGSALDSHAGSNALGSLSLGHLGLNQVLPGLDVGHQFNRTFAEQLGPLVHEASWQDVVEHTGRSIRERGVLTHLIINRRPILRHRRFIVTRPFTGSRSDRRGRACSM